MTFLLFKGSCSFDGANNATVNFSVDKFACLFMKSSFLKRPVFEISRSYFPLSVLKSEEYVA